MLREIEGVRQDDPALRRRWFTDERMDLTAWQDADLAVVAFQLAYDKPAAERALTWRRGRGCDHAVVDEGRSVDPRHKGSPLLLADGAVPWSRLRREFAARARRIDPAVAAAVRAVLDGARRG